MFSSQRFAPGTYGVEQVGLRAVAARRSVRPVELDDQFAAFGEVAGQPGAIAAGALDRPRPKPRVPIGHRHQLGVPVDVGVDRDLVGNGAGDRGDDGSSVGVLVSIDADDDIDEICQHGHAFFSFCQERT